MHEGDAVLFCLVVNVKMVTLISLVTVVFVTILTNALLIPTSVTAMHRVLIELMAFPDMTALVTLDISVMDSNVKMKTNVI